MFTNLPGNDFNFCYKKDKKPDLRVDFSSNFGQNLGFEHRASVRQHSFYLVFLY